LFSHAAIMSATISSFFAAISKRYPVSSFTMSCIPSKAFAATIVHESKASTKTKPKDSLRDGPIKRSAVA